MKKCILCGCFLVTLASMASAQTLRVSQIEIATAINNRQPTGVDTLFSPTVGRLFCFTQIRGASDSTKISQIWYYKDQEKARVELNVKSNDWRTWSSKSILESWTGPWRVMVVDAHGNVLATKSFRIASDQSLAGGN